VEAMTVLVEYGSPWARWRSGWPLAEYVKCGADALQPVLVTNAGSDEERYET